ncbi:MAG: hypothetical protein JWM07_374 [Candidatus Saccharibacteria bacterium]|nr:hypothetical protein [Candidatus Saccharibacteria bacterium]
MKRKMLFAFFCAVIIIAAAIFFFVSNNTTLSEDPLPAQTTQAPSLTSENAQALERLLGSSDKNEQAQALAPGLRDGEWASNEVLPDGATLTIQHDTFTVDADGYGQVDAVVGGTLDARFILGLVFINDQWLIYTTEQKG